MLKEFTVSNFRSIVHEQTFTMEASPARQVSEHPEHILSLENERLLKVSSFYGPNGGGKSNLLLALRVLREVALGHRIPLAPMDEQFFFAPVHSEAKTTSFQIFFVTRTVELGYSLKVDLTAVDEFVGQNILPPYQRRLDYRIQAESLAIRPLKEKDFLLIYERDADGRVRSDRLVAFDIMKNRRELAAGTTFLSYVGRSFRPDDTSLSLGSIFQLYEEFHNIRLLFHTGSFWFIRRQSLDLAPYLGRLTAFLNAFDLAVTSVEFKKNSNNDLYHLVIKRKIHGRVSSLPLFEESMGTKKLVALLLEVLSTPGNKVFLADDLDASLHPKIIEAIIALFTASDNRTKQFIFNSHDMINMNSDVFRRDEIWFAWLDDDHSTVYAPLSNIRNYKGHMIRKDAIYGKQYLENRYGADPFIAKGLSWDE